MKKIILILVAAHASITTAHAQTPTVGTNPAVNITPQGATIGTTIYPNDTLALGWIEHGYTLATCTLSVPVPIYAQQTITDSLIDLSCDTTCFYRGAATNNSGTTYGTWYAFHTLNCIVTKVEILSVPDVTIAPNPIITEANITLALPENGALELYDALGQLVGTSQIESGGGKIQRENLISGIYFYRIRTDSGSYAGKIIIE